MDISFFKKAKNNISEIGLVGNRQNVAPVEVAVREQKHTRPPQAQHGRASAKKENAWKK